MGRTVVAVVLFVLATSLSAEAQRPPDVRRIGYLGGGVDRQPARFPETLRDSLRDLGHVEGRNLIIECRAGDTQARLELAAELVRLKVEVVVVPGATTYAAMQATHTVPIVFAYSGDPIVAGFARSLGRPGGNMTGITWLAFELVGKRLEILKEAAPRLSRVAVLANPAHPGEERELAETERAARALGVAVRYHRVRATADFRAAFDAIARDGTEAILVFSRRRDDGSPAGMAEFAAKHGLPSVFGWREYVDAGGLIAYGPNRGEGRRDASPCTWTRS